jgi:hypothetical protein
MIKDFSENKFLFWIKEFFTFRVLYVEILIIGELINIINYYRRFYVLKNYFFSNYSLNFLLAIRVIFNYLKLFEIPSY